MTITLGWWMLPFVAWLILSIHAGFDDGDHPVTIALVIAFGWALMAAARWL
jgi:hypothetical protein